MGNVSSNCTGWIGFATCATLINGILNAPTNIIPDTLRLRVIYATVVASIAGLIYGFDTVTFGTVSSGEDFLRTFFLDIYNLRKDTGGDELFCSYTNIRFQLFNYVHFISGGFACIIASYVTKEKGHVKSLCVAGIAFLVGSTLCACAVNTVMLYLGRIIFGVGLGFGNQAAPIYIADIAPTRHRGTLNVVFELFFALGIFVANVAKFYLDELRGHLSWKLMHVVQAIFALLLLLLSSFSIYEAPSWYALRGNIEDALAVIGKMRGGVDTIENENEVNSFVIQAQNPTHGVTVGIQIELSDGIDEHFHTPNSSNFELDVDENLAELSDGIDEHFHTPNSSNFELDADENLAELSDGIDEHFHTPNSSTFELDADENSQSTEMPSLFFALAQWRNVPQIIIAVVLQICQQLTGITFTITICTHLFKELDYASKASLYAALYIGLMRIGSTLLSCIIVDKVGRRNLLLVVGIAMSVIQLVLATVLSSETDDGVKHLSKSQVKAVIVGMLILIAAYALSWGPLGWLLPSETFPLDCRYAGQSLTVFVSFLSVGAVDQLYVQFSCQLKFCTLLFFACFVISMTWFVFSLVLETRGIRTNDMIRTLWKQHHIWKYFYVEEGVQ